MSTSKTDNKHKWFWVCIVGLMFCFIVEVIHDFIEDAHIKSELKTSLNQYMDFDSVSVTSDIPEKYPQGDPNHKNHFLTFELKLINGRTVAGRALYSGDSKTVTEIYIDGDNLQLAHPQNKYHQKDNENR
jgi:hypothetical protein